MLLRRAVLLFAAAAMLTVLTTPTVATAQGAEMPDWQKAAGGKMQFEVASVRQDTSEEFKSPSIALSVDDGSQPKDGLFHTDFPLLVDIGFAYKMSLSPEQREAMLASLPKWVRTDRYDIEARSDSKPTKDQVRLMMQALLAERFGLKVHFETQTVPVLAMTLVKPGKLGPKLIPHSEGPACPESLPPGTPQPATPPGKANLFPECGVYSMDSTDEHTAVLGSRNTTMMLLAKMLPTVGALGRPVVDQTGLTGKYDVTVEFSPEATRAARTEASADAQPETQGIPFLQAVREQLGLKLDSAKAPVQVLVIDHIERPSEN
jgi:uncharacterized protein (TIGR03435 family)